VRNANGAPITAVYAIVRLHAPPRPLSSAPPLPLLNETSSSTVHYRNPPAARLPPLPHAPDAKPPPNISSPPPSPVLSGRPRVRIIPYNYIRFATTPSGLEIEIKLSCFYAEARQTERERERERVSE